MRLRVLGVQPGRRAVRLLGAGVVLLDVLQQDAQVDVRLRVLGVQPDRRAVRLLGADVVLLHALQQDAQAVVRVRAPGVQPDRHAVRLLGAGIVLLHVVQFEPFAQFVVCSQRLRLPWLPHRGALTARLRGCERVRAAARPLGAASALLFSRSRTDGQNSLESAVRTAHQPERSQAGFGK